MHSASAVTGRVTGLLIIGAQLALPAVPAYAAADAQMMSVSERQRFILRVRTIARAVAESYYASREALGFPMVESVKKQATG